jgi:hypothetical protein
MTSSRIALAMIFLRAGHFDPNLTHLRLGAPLDRKVIMIRGKLLGPSRYQDPL